MIQQKLLPFIISICLFGPAVAQAQKTKPKDAKNSSTGKKTPFEDPAYRQYGIYAKSAPRPEPKAPVDTALPLQIQNGARISLIGNMLLERSQYFGYLETILQQEHAGKRITVRNLGWPGDTPDTQPRPDNFADTDQHLTHEKADIVIAAFGFNESFKGKAGVVQFQQSLSSYVTGLKTKAFNGKTPPQVVLLSPIANENVDGVKAADQNNDNLKLYADAIRDVAKKQNVGFIDLFTPTLPAATNSSPLTFNGVHLNDHGYQVVSRLIAEALCGSAAKEFNQEIRQVVVDKNRQFFRRFRPLNTFYYTGGRSKTYGYLDFLPAMQNFQILTQNRDQRIWDLAEGKTVTKKIDDSNAPAMPETKQSRGANRWMSSKDELAEFKVDPRFDVNLFASEEEFPEIAAPIQMRWDNRGRLWVSCSTTYPHVYPGFEPNDRLVILEDTDGDGHADKSSVFADDLHIPLSFEFGDGGVYVSEMPHLTFLKDTDGDGKADMRKQLLSGFGTEDSHHSLHDFAWTPDGGLLFRESIFHHSQVETPYGPIRQQNSGWFRFDPDTQRLTSFGTYHSTNPWGVTFDDWGQHVASHPIYAAAFHSLDPSYPNQHPKPAGLRAYSGTCGQEFIDFAHYPDDMQGGYVKARYKPTNRIEIHRWKETEFGFDEEYVSDLIFSSNLSFIPVDIRYGPRGAMYICDWYNPVKGHAQYSLRDQRRDRHSGRIWRVTPKNTKLPKAPKIAGASVNELLDMLKRPESRIRYWVRRELRERDANEVLSSLDRWVAGLAPDQPRYRHHQLEAVWIYRGIGATKPDLLRELLSCDEPLARSAATHQLRHWHTKMDDALDLLRASANDPHAVVRMQAAIAASHIGTKDALLAMLDVTKHPSDGHLAYAITCALGSKTLRPHWENDATLNVKKLLQQSRRSSMLREPTPAAQDAQFDTQKNLAKFEISCLPEVMKFTKEQIAVTVGQPVKIVFTNPDATDHNMVFVKPGALEEVGMAANEMAKDPKHAMSDFIPKSKRGLILHASKMIGPTRKRQVHVFRFKAPEKPGLYPYVCTFPGHWVIMKGVMVVAKDLSEVDQMVAKSKPAVIQQWKMEDLADLKTPPADDQTIMKGMVAFAKARCDQCHVLGGHGVNLGPDLKDVSKRFPGTKLLKQLLLPSSEINEKYQTQKFLLSDGRVISGVVAADTGKHLQVITNLLTPKSKTKIAKNQIEGQVKSTISAMPQGLLDVLTKEEIQHLMTYLRNPAYPLPKHLKMKMKH